MRISFIQCQFYNNLNNPIYLLGRQSTKTSKLHDTNNTLYNLVPMNSYKLSL